MPKTVDKRAQARRTARVQQAHQTAPEQAGVKRTASRKRKPKTGLAGFIQRYPLASALIVIAVVGSAVLLMSSLHLGPWYVAPVPPCNLKTHECQPNAWKAQAIDASKSYTATIHTAKGDILIALDAKNTPKTVQNFVFLANQHWYDGTYFWRVEAPGLQSPLGGTSTLQLIQGGSVSDTGGDGSTVPGYTIPDELGTTKDGYGAGTVAMANTGQPNTGSAQFFIDTGDNTSQLSKAYTVFGHVTAGMDIAKKISPKDKITSITIVVK